MALFDRGPEDRYQPSVAIGREMESIREIATGDRLARSRLQRGVDVDEVHAGNGLGKLPQARVDLVHFVQLSVLSLLYGADDRDDENVRSGQGAARAFDPLLRVVEDNSCRNAAFDVVASAIPDDKTGAGGGNDAVEESQLVSGA